MTANIMLTRIVLSQKATVAEGKRIVKLLTKLSKHTQLTESEFNFVVKLHTKYCQQ